MKDWIGNGIDKGRVAEPEPKLLAGAGAGAGIKFQLRLPAAAPGEKVKKVI
jgi:hypothetical protein